MVALVTGCASGPPAPPSTPGVIARTAVVTKGPSPMVVATKPGEIDVYVRRGSWQQSARLPADVATSHAAIVVIDDADGDRYPDVFVKLDGAGQWTLVGGDGFTWRRVLFGLSDVVTNPHQPLGNTIVTDTTATRHERWEYDARMMRFTLRETATCRPDCDHAFREGPLVGA